MFLGFLLITHTIKNAEFDVVVVAQLTIKKSQRNEAENPLHAVVADVVVLLAGDIHDLTSNYAKLLSKTGG